MDENQFKELLLKYESGKCTEEEKILLDNWYLQWKPDNVSRLTESSIQNSVDGVWNKIENREFPKSKIYQLWPKVAAAAAIIIIVGGSIIFRYRTQEHSATDLTTSVIKPGTEGATLTLASGKRIILKNTVNGILAKEAGVSIKKTSKGTIEYKIEDRADNEPNQTNSLSTANGQMFKITLPDQTAVWLNAASSIRYPVSFSGAKNRIVQLSGEAYFEVAKDKIHPFIVETTRQRVAVLGTHFNINSYSDNANTTTTLLEGRVSVSHTGQANDNYGVVLKPDQQSVLVANNSFQIQEVVSGDAIAWKNGYFMFNNESLGNIMQTLSRWYNANMVYEDESLKNELVFAKLSRYENITKILKLLERTDKIKFKVTGNTITISRNIRAH